VRTEEREDLEKAIRASERKENEQIGDGMTTITKHFYATKRHKKAIQKGRGERVFEGDTRFPFQTSAKSERKRKGD
jgi:hypothetical protein